MKSFINENRLMLWGALSFAIAALAMDLIVHALHVHI
jgi:hypothetical protein